MSFSSQKKNNSRKKKNSKKKNFKFEVKNQIEIKKNFVDSDFNLLEKKKNFDNKIKIEENIINNSEENSEIEEFKKNLEIKKKRFVSFGREKNSETKIKKVEKEKKQEKIKYEDYFFKK